MFDYETSMEIMTDSPAISSEDFSSPYEEDEGNSPNLRIIMAHADNGYGNDYGPPSALDTSRAGGTCFEEGMFNTLENLDHDDDDPKFYEILNGAEGTEGTERNPEEDLELDLSPNEPDLERVSVENSDPPPFAGPKTTLSTEASGLKGNVASGSVHRYPTTRFNSLYPSITAVQPPQNDTGKPVSSSQYSRHAARSDSNGATTINREMSMPLQHQTFNSNTQSRVQAPSHYVQSVRPVPSTDTNTSRFDHTLPQRHFAQQARNQPQQRPASTEPSTFQLQQQQQQVGRRKPQRFYPHSSFLEDRRQTGYQTQTASPRFEQGQLFPHDNGLQGFQGSGSPQLDTHYAQLHDSDNKSYDSTLWQHLQHTPGEIMVLPHRGVINAEDDTLFGSMLDAKMWREQHLVPTGKVDDTIPRSPEEQKHVVKRLFDAINDTSDAMISTYVKYFEEHKYTAQFIESEACILRHTHGPLQAEEERAPFKARIAEFDSCGERIDRLVDALRKQKAICKKLMEPWHVHQVVDDPVGRIKRTENNKALNDRKAKQIAAGKAASCDDNGRRGRKRKQKPQERQESEGSDEEIEEDSVESSPRFHGLHPAFSSPAAVPSNIQSVEPISSRKRKANLESSNIDSSLQPATSGPNAKKVKTTTASPAKLPKTERRKGHSTYQPNQRGEVMEQPDTRASRTQQWQPSSAQVQSSRHGSASAYGNPSTGEIRGNPYFVDPRNTHGRPGGPYPVIEGYNTPSSAYDSQPTFDDSNAVDYHRIHPQHQTPSQRRRRAATDSATSSAYPPSSKYDTQNPNKSFRASAHEQGRGNPKPDDDSSESDFTLAKTKRMKKKT